MGKNLSELIEEYYNEKNNDDLFNAIAQKCRTSINSCARKYYDFDDMRQEGLIKLFSLLQKHKLDSVLKQSDEKILAYIKTAIDNRLKDIIRKQYKIFEKEISVLSTELENICDTLEVFSNLKFIIEETLEELFEKLTEKQKAIMRLLYLDELTENEVAKKMNVERQNINAIKNRAKKTIKANLTQSINGAGQTPLYKANTAQNILYIL